MFKVEEKETEEKRGKCINWNFDVQSGRERDRREKKR
jgi:hypothetical protein